MYCSKCGAQNRDDANKCVICGTALAKPPPEPQEPAADRPPPPSEPPSAAPAAAQAQTAPEVPINNYLVPAILTTIFCCWPTGIVAIIFAAQVSSKIGANDFDGARHASSNAKLWTWITFGLGLAVVGLGVLFGIIGAVSGM